MPTENQSSPPLISSQRHLNLETVRRKAQNFKVFVVRTVELELRGRQYRLLIDGHHNLAAARLVGIEPTWRGPSPKFERFMHRTPPDEFERFMINNLTDSDWYFVETGEVVQELQEPGQLKETSSEPSHLLPIDDEADRRLRLHLLHAGDQAGQDEESKK